MKTCGVKIACQLLNLDRSTVRYHANVGHLKCTRDDANRRRFKYEDILKLARQRKKQAATTKQSDR